MHISISTQARTGIIYLEGRGTNHCTILTIVTLLLVLSARRLSGFTRVKGIEPLLTILEIVALTVILHSLANNFYLARRETRGLSQKNIVISSFNWFYYAPLSTFYQKLGALLLLSFIYSHPH